MQFDNMSLILSRILIRRKMRDLTLEITLFNAFKIAIVPIILLAASGVVSAVLFYYDSSNYVHTLFIAYTSRYAYIVRFPTRRLIQLSLKGLQLLPPPI